MPEKVWISESSSSPVPAEVKFPRTPFELSRWRGGRYACDTPDIMGCRSVLNRLSPHFANSLFFNLLQAKVDSIPIA